MKNIEIDSVYSPGTFEEKIYETWKEKQKFLPNGDKDKFVVLIPPPNVTSNLHLGHALNVTLQDIIVRYKRMKGFKTLWIVGTDHAGIATQVIAEKRLKEEGLKKEDLGREKFIEYVFNIKEDHHKKIKRQIERMGASVDWSRERFTLDAGLNLAVKTVFCKLYEKNLIYKGKYLVNWSVGAKTAISDDEVEYKDVDGFMYHIKYKIKDEDDYIEIATTRPETMFGDSAIMVNPADKRYEKYISKYAIIPILEREIKIITNEKVDMDFGSGAVKVTPAHDPNDYEVGIKENLDFINILNKDGTLNENTPKDYQNLNIKSARAKIEHELETLNMLIKKERHKHKVGHCSRTGSVVEPMVLTQWFVKMKEFAQKGLEALDLQEINFIPKRWENTYRSWLKDIRDWCISRQLWWGHRIPVYYCLDKKTKDCENPMVSAEEITKCKYCESENIKQDEDVLDTWFSSWLWPFSTLGWPNENSADLKEFFPSTTLVTGYDIIFFWVSRMIMISKELFNIAPFKNIYLTPLIRDDKGIKMSKTLGNGIDPIEIIEEHGADALRFTFSYLSVLGEDIKINKEKFMLGAKFVNKIWNATRFLLSNLEKGNFLDFNNTSNQMQDEDKWIFSKFKMRLKNIDKAFQEYNFSNASHEIYEFFWNEFCDWFLEVKKIRLDSEDDHEKDIAITMLIHMLKEVLKALHPFVPFITEELYSKIESNKMLIDSSYPEEEDYNHYELESNGFESIKEIIKMIRNIKSEFLIPLKEKIKVNINFENNILNREVITRGAKIIEKLANCDLSFQNSQDQDVIKIGGYGFTLSLLIRGILDKDKVLGQLEKKLIKLKKGYEITNGKLSNADFVNRASEKLVEEEKIKSLELSSLIKKTEEYIKELL